MKNPFGMTSSGGKGDPAARCLNLIDDLRDEYGAPESEPRHPDLASERPDREPLASAIVLAQDMLFPRFRKTFATTAKFRFPPYDAFVSE